MKDLKKFAKDLSNDKDLAQKVQKAKTAKDVVDIAEKKGYSFDENDLMNVSGGLLVPDLAIKTGEICVDLFKFDKSKIDAQIHQEVSGSKSTAYNAGTVNISKSGNNNK